jgi:hypothetical protein
MINMKNPKVDLKQSPGLALASGLEEAARVKKLSDGDLRLERRNARSLAISVFRNDDCTVFNDEYYAFHDYLHLVERECNRRHLDEDQ